MIIAKINPDGSVIEMFQPTALTDDAGTKHPENIFDIWSDSELNAIGFARVTGYAVQSGKVSTGQVDSFVHGVVVRTHTLIDYVRPPDPAPGDEGYDYDYLRQRNFPNTESLIVALWEMVVEDRPEAADALQLKRSAIKANFPKPAVS